MEFSDISHKGISAEDAMRVVSIMPSSRDRYEAGLMVTAAREVVFKNCMEACEVDMTRFKAFNKDWYYNMLSEQKCVQGCFNTRMIAHFGEQTAKTTDGLQIDFDYLKS